MMESIGAFIKRKRVAAGFSQQALATDCGLKHSSTINRIESGERKVSWEELGNISQVLKNFHIFEALEVAGYLRHDEIHPIHKLYRLNELSKEEQADVQKYIEFLLFRHTSAEIKEE